MIVITLNQIRSQSPCQSGWETLLKAKGKTQADDVEFPFADIIKSNGLDDTLWCLRCLGSEHNGWMRKYAVWCARQVQHEDGLATDDELAAAWTAAACAAAACAAARDAAARDAAARDAVRAAQAKKLIECLTPEMRGG